MFSCSDIYTVTDFSRKPGEHISRLQKTRKPEVLTVNGKAAVVVQDAIEYEKMAQLAEYAESIMSIRQALKEQGRSFNQFAAEFEAKNGIAR